MACSSSDMGERPLFHSTCSDDSLITVLERPQFENDRAAFKLPEPNVVEFLSHPSHVKANAWISGRHACHNAFNVLRNKAVEISLPLSPATAEILKNVFLGVEILRLQPGPHDFASFVEAWRFV